MIPKLTEFRPELVIETFSIEYRKNPRKVNYGNCMRWAYTAYHMFPKVELWSNDGHAFIKYQGKFYDSEELDGVLDWRDLRTNQGRTNITSKRWNRPAFEKWWAANNHISPAWKAYRAMAKHTVKKYA
jgi:hypothetical protein